MSFNRSETLNKLAADLLKAQIEITFAKKDSTNPHFKSKYSDLSGVIETVKGPLNRNNITFLQIVTTDGVETVLLHTSGEFISGVTPIKVVPEYQKRESLTQKDKYGSPLKEIIEGTAYETPQALGSAITYAKRYGLQAIVGVPSEDDDGEKAMGRNNPTPQQSKPQTKAPIKTTVGSLDMNEFDDFLR